MWDQLSETIEEEEEEKKKVQTIERNENGK
jgi:hypothetical protein